jgi:ATP-dependent helicase/nuclease subunit B
MAKRFADAVEALGVRRRILEEGLPEEVFFRDLAAYAAITDAFTAMAGTRKGAVAVSARTFLELAGDVAEANGTSGELSAGGVAFADVVTARNLSWPVVFLCGVVADAFPSRPPMGPFYSRAERERLAKLGLVTRSEESHLAAERLLFYQAATRAEEALYITYPSTDEGGKPKLASFYLDEIKSIVAFAPEDMTAYGPSRIVKGADEAASGAELAAWAGESIGRAKTAEEVPALAAAGAAVYPAFGRALRSAAIEARRESLEGFDYFDGVLTVRAAKAVAGHFPAGRPWSASQLTDYRMCPFRFFLKRVLKAECPEEPDVVPTPLEKGDFAHAFLARFFGEVRGRGMTAALSLGEAAAFKEVFDEAFGAIAAGRERRCGLAGDPFWEMEKGRLRRTLWDFVEDEIRRLTKAGGRYVPAFFELSFGLRRGMRDAASVEAPVEIGEGKRKEKLRGRMDRVDLVDSGEGQDAVRRVAIIDYKLSRTPSGSDVGSLRDMELPVYLLVAPRAVPGEGEVLPASAFYRSVSKLSGQRPVVSFDDDEYPAFCAEVVAAIMQCADGVRRGRFPAQPMRECEPYCAGAGVCRCSEARLEFLAEHNE